MDMDDREHFKTMQNPSARHVELWRKQQREASLRSDPDQAYCLKAAQAICGVYRRDEAHDAVAFANGLAAILSDYSRHVVDYVSDPRTGVATEYPMGLPNVGQIRDFCDATARRMELLAKPPPVAKPYIPPPILPGQVDSTEFLRRVKAGELKARPIGPFEKLGDEWNRV